MTFGRRKHNSIFTPTDTLYFFTHQIHGYTYTNPSTECQPMHESVHPTGASTRTIPSFGRCNALRTADVFQIF